MTQPKFKTAALSKQSRSMSIKREGNLRRRRVRRRDNQSDVLISAVVSTYLLTHLHQVLQRAEFGAEKDGRKSQAANFAQLRKVLCMDARSMQDASAVGMRDSDFEQPPELKNHSKVA